MNNSLCLWGSRIKMAKGISALEGGTFLKDLETDESTASGCNGKKQPRKTFSL